MNYRITLTSASIKAGIISEHNFSKGDFWRSLFSIAAFDDFSISGMARYKAERKLWLLEMVKKCIKVIIGDYISF